MGEKNLPKIQNSKIQTSNIKNPKIQWQKLYHYYDDDYWEFQILSNPLKTSKNLQNPQKKTIFKRNTKFLKNDDWAEN